MSGETGLLRTLGKATRAGGAQGDPRFSLRSCPNCGSEKRCLVIGLRAEQFCAVNWTYSRQYAQILGLDDRLEFPIDKCEACGFLYARYLPSGDFLATVYDSVISVDQCKAGSETPAGFARRMRYLAAALELVPQGKAARVLDYGCGMGATMRLLRGCGIEAVGYDPSRVRSGIVADRGFSVVTEEKDLAPLGPFDLVICDNVLEHVPSPMAVIALLASICRPGAVLFASVPEHGERSVSREVKAARRDAPVSMSLNPWEHLNFFDAKSLDRMLASRGFCRIPGALLPSAVDIGLRPDPSLRSRFFNSLASLLRLARYAATGKACESACGSFYRFHEQGPA